MDEDDLRRHLHDMAAGDAPPTASVRSQMDVMRRAAHRRRQRLSMFAAAAVVVVVTGTVTLVATGSGSDRPVDPGGPGTTTSVDTGNLRPDPSGPVVSAPRRVQPDPVAPTRRTSSTSRPTRPTTVVSPPPSRPTATPAPTTPPATTESTPRVQTTFAAPVPSGVLEVTQVPRDSTSPPILILSPDPTG